MSRADYISAIQTRAAAGIRRVVAAVDSVLRFGIQKLNTHRLRDSSVTRLNLCSGTQKIPGYLGIGLPPGVDLWLDLSRNNLPFADSSLDAVVCISAINYFTRVRGQELVNEVYRVLRPGGIARFGVQDMEILARRYVEKDREFFMQKLSDGTDRFEGPTLGDKFAAWFYGYAIRGFPCRYFYDYESLSYLFKAARFSRVERKAYRESALEHIDLIDNRPDQMFFLEAIK